MKFGLLPMPGFGPILVESAGPVEILLTYSRTWDSHHKDVVTNQLWERMRAFSCPSLP